MWICGFAAKALWGEWRVYDSFPSKELQDYWSTRPKYEDVDPESGDFVSGSSSRAGSSGDGDGGSSSQSYQEWLAQQKESKEEPPPLLYSLEEDEATAAPAQPTTTTALSSSASAAAAPTEGSGPATCSEPPVINTPSTGL